MYILVRDQEGVGSGTQPLEVTSVRAEKRGDGHAVRDSNIDDIDRNRGVLDRDIYGGHSSRVKRPRRVPARRPNQRNTRLCFWCIPAGGPP